MRSTELREIHGASKHEPITALRLATIALVTGSLLGGVWAFWPRAPKSLMVPEPAPSARRFLQETGEASPTNHFQVRPAPPRTALMAAAPPPKSSTNTAAVAPPVRPEDVKPVESWDDMVARWNGEKPDPDWTTTALGYMDALIDQVDGSPDLLREVDCRRSLCRILLRAADQDALLQMNSLSRADNRTFAIRNDEDGRGVTVFAPREGFEGLLSGEAGIP